MEANSGPPRLSEHSWSVACSHRAVIVPTIYAPEQQQTSTQHLLVRGNSFHRRWSAVAVCTALIGIFLLDRGTGTAPVQHLYYLSIIYAAIVYTWVGGLLSATAAIALYHIANQIHFIQPHREPDVVQVILFLAVALIAAKLTSDSQRLHVLATTDDLTGLHNLRSFEAHFTRMVRKARVSRFSTRRAGRGLRQSQVD